MLLSMFDLNNGVANDAVNFLNSAIGSKAAPGRVILTVASIGVLVGAVFSSGMMEVARSGIFVPSMFTFHEVMLLFLGVMIAEVILLDTFNTFGLPTSTTVSLVFGLLGAAVASAWYHVSTHPEDTTPITAFLNLSKATEIISSILLSVVFAFTLGAIVMWLSRVLFSFHYQRPFKWVGSVWSGFAMTAICYFAIVKGLKDSSLMSKENLTWIDTNLVLFLSAFWGCCTVLLAVLQHLFMSNILRLTVLAGTFSLALAFAGNDLVNFIGVFMGSLTAFDAAQSAPAGTDIANMKMTALVGKAHANPLILLSAGAIMVFALWFSKKAKSVIATGVELSRQNDGGIERFGSVPPARAIVRNSLALGKVIRRLLPQRAWDAIDNKWKPTPQPTNPKDRVAFDLIRATVNLTVASLLITWGTAQKLPLSTTYVTFMVAMGTSLSDRAWGRESAVYRVTGVLTVISGWFMTGLAAFSLAFVIAIILNWGQAYAIFPLLGLTAFFLVKSAVFHQKREGKKSASSIENVNEENIMESCTRSMVEGVDKLRAIYTAAIDSFLVDDRKGLRDASDDALQLATQCTEHLSYDIVPLLSKMQSKSIDTGYHFVQALNHLKLASNTIDDFTTNVFNYVDNNHAPFSPEQIEDIREIHTRITKYFQDLAQMIRSGNYAKYDESALTHEAVLQAIAKIVKRQIKRTRSNATRTRSSLLFINMMNDLRGVTNQARLLTSNQRDFVIG